MSNLQTPLIETRVRRRDSRAGQPAMIALHPAPIDALDDFTLDIDVDAAIEACEGLS